MSIKRFFQPKEKAALADAQPKLTPLLAGKPKSKPNTPNTPSSAPMPLKRKPDSQPPGEAPSKQRQKLQKALGDDSKAAGSLECAACSPGVLRASASALTD